MSVLRRAAERLSRGVVVRRRLPRRFGSARVFVSPDAALRYWRLDLGRAAPEVFAWVEELVRPGEVVWDIGANLGLFSIAAAIRAGAKGRVLACEPDPWLCGLIARSLRGLPGSASPVDLLGSAVADADGSESFALSGRGRAASHLERVAGTSQAGGSRGAIRVPIACLDSLVAGRRPPTLLKIDVEGAEALVLRGAEKVLRDFRPTLLVEVGPEASEEVGARLRGLGYRMFDAELPAGSRVESTVPFWNTLAFADGSERNRR